MFYMASNRAGRGRAVPEVDRRQHQGPRTPASSLADYYMRHAAGRPRRWRCSRSWPANKDGFAEAKVAPGRHPVRGGKTAEAHKTIDEVLAKDAEERRARCSSRRGSSCRRTGSTRRWRRRRRRWRPTRARPRRSTCSGSIYVRQEQHRRGDQGVQRGPEDQPARRRRAAQLSRLQMTKGPRRRSAVQFAEQAVTTQPGNPVARLMLVRSLMVKGDLPRAETELKALLSSTRRRARCRPAWARCSCSRATLPARAGRSRRRCSWTRTRTRRWRASWQLDLASEARRTRGAGWRRGSLRRRSDPAVLHARGADLCHDRRRRAGRADCCSRRSGGARQPPGLRHARASCTVAEEAGRGAREVRGAGRAPAEAGRRRDDGRDDPADAGEERRGAEAVREGDGDRPARAGGGEQPGVDVRGGGREPGRGAAARADGQGRPAGLARGERHARLDLLQEEPGRPGACRRCTQAVEKDPKNPTYQLPPGHGVREDGQQRQGPGVDSRRR